MDARAARFRGRLLAVCADHEPELGGVRAGDRSGHRGVRQDGRLRADPRLAVETAESGLHRQGRQADRARRPDRPADPSSLLLGRMGARPARFELDVVEVAHARVLVRLALLRGDRGRLLLPSGVGADRIAPLGARARRPVRGGQPGLAVLQDRHGGRAYDRPRDHAVRGAAGEPLGPPLALGPGRVRSRRGARRQALRAVCRSGPARVSGPDLQGAHPCGEAAPPGGAGHTAPALGNRLRAVQLDAHGLVPRHRPQQP